MLPFVYDKTLYYRNPRLTNVRNDFALGFVLRLRQHRCQRRQVVRPLIRVSGSPPTREVAVLVAGPADCRAGHRHGDTMIRYIIRRDPGRHPGACRAELPDLLHLPASGPSSRISRQLCSTSARSRRHQAAPKLIEHRYGFDLPVWKQYLNWLHGIFFGRDLGDDTSMRALLGAVPGLLIPAEPAGHPHDPPGAAGRGSAWPRVRPSSGWSVALTIGSISALKRGTLFDRSAMTMALAAVSLPIFFTGPILLLIFKYKLKLAAEHPLRAASPPIPCSGSSR